MDMMSLQLRPLVCTALTTVVLSKHCKCCAVAAKAVEVFHGTSRSSCSGPTQAAFGTQNQWCAHIQLQGSKCRWQCSGRGCLQTHDSGGNQSSSKSGPTVASLAATEALVVRMLSVAAHSLKLHTHP